MTKHQCRENVFLILFEASFHEDALEELFSLAEEIGEIEINTDVKNFVSGVISQQQQLDEIIASYSPKRAVSRIARVNLILLRMAIYEIRQRKPETPVNVSVSEAIALSEIYASAEDTAFINGILGSYARNLTGEHAQ